MGLLSIPFLFCLYLSRDAWKTFVVESSPDASYVSSYQLNSDANTLAIGGPSLYQQLPRMDVILEVKSNADVLRCTETITSTTKEK